MVNMATEANITIKLLIDTEANKVIFAEASKDFVDFLFLLLVLPIGSVIKLLKSGSMVGSIAHIYTSFENLNHSYVQPNIQRNVLLNPRIKLPSVSTNIPLPISNKFVAASQNNTTVTPPNDNMVLQGYVKEMVTYMVADDLHVTPLSTMLIISMTNKCNASKLEEREVNIGTKEALELLNSSFRSTTVLTDVFLGRKQDKSKAHEVEDAIPQLSQELEERNEEIELSPFKELNKALIMKERRSSDELQDARRELINVFETLPGGTNVAIKMMGEIELSPFAVACKRKYGAEKDWGVKFLEMASIWESKIMDPEWHPFKMTVKEGNDQDMQEVVDEDDSMLKELRSEWGDEVYNAIVKALMEINEYNPSRQHAVVKEVWNFKEDRKASLREAIQCLCDQLKNPPAQSDKRRRAK